MADYLRECFERFGAVTCARYGRIQDLETIERQASGVLKAGRLTYDDVETVLKADQWQGGEFWQWPDPEEFSHRCGRRPFVILPTPLTPKTEPVAIDRLLEIFRHIEPVSVVMRFIDPKNYGIMSPPVEKLLEIGPTYNPRDKYLNYVKDLQDLCDMGRGFETAAEVDMALWVMSYAVRAEKSGIAWLMDVAPEYETWANEFRSDNMLLRIRVRNLANSLFDGIEMPELAEALMPEHIEGGEPHENKKIVLSARIAAIEFEQAIKRISEWYPDDCKDDGGKFSLRKAVEAISTSKRWRKAVDTRNDVVHPDADGSELAPGDVNDLLCAMREAVDRADRLTGL